MSPILDVTSLLPTGIAFDMVVDMVVVGFQKEVGLFIIKRNLEEDGCRGEILKPQEWSHVIGEISKSDCNMSNL